MTFSCLPLLTICVTVSTVISGQPDISASSSWAKLQISPDTLVSMAYGNFRVDIYEHANNHKSTTTPSNCKYFYAPIALLDHQGATSSFNNVTKKAEMRFRIEMWNDKVQNQVVNYLGKVVGRQVDDHQVQVIPFENVILSSTSSSNIYSLGTDWKSYRQHKFFWFTLSCIDQKDCDQLADNMRNNPQQFDHLKLQFSWSAQTSKTKETAIRIENVMSGQLVSDLLQRFDQKNKEIWLTFKDEKRILKETATNVLVESFDNTDVVSPDSESQINNILKNLLFSSTKIIKNESDKTWELVFWNEEIDRPDQMAKKLNDIYNNLDKESQNKMSEVYQHQKSNKQQSTKMKGLNNLTVQTNLTSGSMKIEDLDKLYQTSKDYVEWNGDKFVPKPLTASKINLTQLRDKKSLQDRKLIVKYSTSVLSTPINFVQNSHLTLTDEWQNLKEEVEGNSQLLAHVMTTMENMQKEINASAASTSIGRMPKSCDDLQKIGHRKSGLYPVMGDKTVDNVYCDFTKPINDGGFQKVIGFFDVKTLPVYFHAQKNKSHTTGNTAVPFEILRLNVGNAMNTSGVFVVPKSGKYFFAYSGLSEGGIHARVDLQVKTDAADWTKVGQAYGQAGYNTFSLQATLDLAKGNQIRLLLAEGQLHDNDNRYTSFVGQLLDEEIVQ
uniref:C1q domain-containing protein n=1 Tax=Daphnia galeata TaxID=27404 RepID=A0A8J2RD74_9CRUS|nr:unnamed protein product [Daphnia galeata]